MYPSPRQSLWMIVASLAATMAMAQEQVIGYVKSADATASVVIAGQPTPARPGTPLRQGYVLKTGRPGSMGVTLKDNTLLSIGPDTELALDDYIYSPGKGELKLDVNVTRGSLYYVSGVIAKLKPDAVRVKTPSGLIGVRGTQFAVKVEPEAEK